MVKKEFSNVERRKNLTTAHGQQRDDNVVSMCYSFAWHSFWNTVFLWKTSWIFLLISLRSGSIFVSLWKLHSGGQGETVAVRENVWEPLKLGLISGCSWLVSFSSFVYFYGQEKDVSNWPFQQFRMYERITVSKNCKDEHFHWSFCFVSLFRWPYTYSYKFSDIINE